MGQILAPRNPPLESPGALKSLLVQKDRQILQLMHKIKELENELNSRIIRTDPDKQ